MLNLTRSKIQDSPLYAFLPVACVFSLPLSTALTSVLAYAMLLLWLGTLRDPKTQAALVHPIVMPLLIYLGVLLLGCLYGPATLEGMKERLSDGARLLFIPIFMIYFRSPVTYKKSFLYFLGAMMIVFLAGVLKMYFELPFEKKHTMAAVFKTHITTNFLMALALFYALYFAWQHPKRRYLLGFMAVCFFYYIFYMSMGRVGYFSVFVLALYSCYHFYGKKGLLLSIGALGAVGALLYFSSDVFQGRMLSLFKEWDHYEQGNMLASSLGSRLQFYQGCLHLFLEHPWLGWGTGSFSKAYHAFQIEHYLYTTNPHNTLLLILVENGLLGLMALIYLWQQQWRLLNELPPKPQFLSKATFILFVFGCTFNSWLIDFTESYFYIFMTAMSLSMIHAWRPGDRATVRMHA